MKINQKSIEICILKRLQLPVYLDLLVFIY